MVWGHRRNECGNLKKIYILKKAAEKAQDVGKMQDEAQKLSERAFRGDERNRDGHLTLKTKSNIIVVLIFIFLY